MGAGSGSYRWILSSLISPSDVCVPLISTSSPSSPLLYPPPFTSPTFRDAMNLALYPITAFINLDTGGNRFLSKSYYQENTPSSKGLANRKE